MRNSTTSSSWRSLTVLLVSLIGFGATAMAVTAVQTNRRNDRIDAFENESRALRTAIATSLDSIEVSLVEQRAAAIVAWPLDRDDFHAMAVLASAGRAREGVQTTGFVRAIAADQTQAYERGVRGRADDPVFAEFTVQPATTPHDDRFVVEYLEPLTGNESGIGFDLGTDETQRTAVEEARDRGVSVATAPIDLVQAGRAVLVATPIYDTGDIPISPPGRRRHFVGVLSAAVTPAPLVRGAIDDSQLDVELFDVGPTAQPPRTVLTESDRLLDADPSSSMLPLDGIDGLHRVLDIDLGGRRWRLVTTPGPEFTAGQGPMPWLVGLGGSAMVIMMVIALRTVVGARERAEELVERRTASLRRLVSQAPDATVVIDDEGVIALASEQVRELLGYEPEELIGRSVDTLVPHGRRAGHAALRAGFVDEAENRMLDRSRLLVALHADGTEVPVEISLSMLPRGDTIGRVIASLRDVTLQRRAEDELRRAMDQQRSFLATVSHELQTPLTAIQGFTRLLLERGDRLTDEQTREYLERVHRNSDGLHGLIAELLEFSRLEHEDSSPPLVPERVDTVVLDVVDQLASILDDHTVSVEVEPVVAMIDVAATRRAVTNLLSNAHRYSPPSSEIAVKVRSVDDDAVITVDDAGPGVPEDERDQIFERFWRGNHSAGVPGTGIGLALVKQLVEQQHGTVAAKLSPLGGARFEIRLPAVDHPVEHPSIAHDEATQP